VSFKYRILNQGPRDPYLYILARSPSAGPKGEQGWTPIKAPNGASGSQTISITINDKPDYRIIIGFHNEGRVAIDDVTITKKALVRIVPPRALAYNPEEIGFNTGATVWSPADQVARLYDRVTQTGAHWVRSTLFWDTMEPARGKINWTGSDMLFDTIRKRGLKYCCVIRSAPKWANGGYDTPLHNYAPTDADAFGMFCYQVAQRYLTRGVTITFEIGNEENMQFFNMPAVDPAAYTRCQLIPAAKGIRKAAQELGVAAPTVLVGGFSPVEPRYVPRSMTPLDFMRGIYANGGKGSFDSIAYHPYTYVAAPSATHWTYLELQRVVDLMKENGDAGKKIWATEVGYATGTGTGEISEDDAGTFTASTFGSWFSLPYAGPLIWYELVDGHSYDSSNRENTFGLLHSDGSPKPAYEYFLSKLRKQPPPPGRGAP
ncbi:MAG: hypothetical protein M3Y56_16505, partial [Armatimonadota bacterium]|nr:hypothetical protein [Armatimonadota bacterium]